LKFVDGRLRINECWLKGVYPFEAEIERFFSVFIISADWVPRAPGGDERPLGFAGK